MCTPQCYHLIWASLVAQMVKNLPAIQETWLWSLGGKIPWRRKWQPTLVFLPRESHGQRSLVGYSPWGCKELDTTEQLTLFSLSPLNPEIPFLGMCTKEWKAGQPMFIYHCSKQHYSHWPKVDEAQVSISGWMGTKMWCIHAMEYYSPLKRKEVLTHATTWRKLEDIMLSEISQTQKDRHCMIPLKWSTWTNQFIERTAVTKGWGEGKMRSYCLMGIEFRF